MPRFFVGTPLNPDDIMQLPDDVVRRHYAETKHALCCLNCGFEYGFDPTQPGSICKPLWVLLEHECRSAES